MSIANADNAGDSIADIEQVLQRTVSGGATGGCGH